MDNKSVQKIFYKTVIKPFVIFCAVAGNVIDLGLSAEQLLCLFDECLEVARYHHDHLLCIICCPSNSSPNYKQGKSADTVRYKAEVLESLHAMGLLAHEMTVCLEVGNTYRVLKKPESAIIYFKRGAGLAKRLSAKHEEMEANMLLYESYQSLNQYENAVPFIMRNIEIAKETNGKANLAYGYLFLGNAYKMLNQVDKVIKYGKKSIEVASNTEDEELLIAAYDLVGDAYNKLNQFDDAVHYYKMSNNLAKVKGHVNLEMQSLLHSGHLYLDGNDIMQAISYFKRCLDLACKTDNQQIEMEACLNLGLSYELLNQYDKAIIHLDQCINLAFYFDDKYTLLNAYVASTSCYKQNYNNAILASKMGIALAKELGNKPTEMQVDVLLIYVYQTFKKYEFALLHAKECLEDAQKTAFEEFEVEMHRSIGFSYHELGKLDDAIQCCNTCIELIKVNPLGSADCADSVFVLEGQLNSQDQFDDTLFDGVRCYQLSVKLKNRTLIGDILVTLADVYRLQDKYQESLFYSKQAIEYAKKNNDKTVQCADVQNLNIVPSNRSNNRRMECRALLITGSTYDNGLSKYDEGQAYLNKGLQIAEELADKDLVEEFKICLAGIDHSVGASIKTPYPCQSKIKEIFKDSGRAKELGLLRTAGEYASQQDYEGALKLCQEVEALHVERNFSNSTVKINIANLNFILGRYDTALTLYHEMTQLLKKTGDKNGEAECHFGISRIFFVRDALKDAEERVRESIKCLETMFVFLGKNDDFKISFVDRYIAYYEFLTYILLMTSRDIEAFEALDCYRARALKSQLILNYRMNEDVQEEEIQFAEMQSSVSKNNFTIIQYFAFKTKIASQKNVLYTFLVTPEDEVKLVRQEKNYSSKTLDSHINSAYVRHRSLNIDEETPDDRKKDIEVFRKDELFEFLFHLANERSLVFRHFEVPEASEDDDEGSANSGQENLYNTLIKNVMDDLKTDEIVFIPDGSLYKVPFAALRDPETGRYLSEIKRIRIAPSISTLKILNDRPADFECKSGALIVGDPLVGTVMYDGKKDEFSTLHMAYEEALAISKVFGVQPLTGEKATKAAVIEILHQGVSVVHFAAHGDSKKATIVLAPSPEVRASKIPEEEDYMLTMADVQKAQVRAKLVVLACCKSGRGEIRAEGVVGMCRAFLASGARAVVAALRAIDDGATCEFMIQFYQNLKEKKSASLSLQLTMEYMRKTQRYNQPGYWAPFILMGDDVTIF